LIVFNTIFIGFEVESNLQQAKAAQPTVALLSWIDLGFTIAFVLEFVLRAVVYRTALITGEDRYWNLFEFALTVTSVLEWVIQIVDLTFMRSLRFLRAVRAIRVFRVVRVVRELRLMVASVICSLPSLMWASIFLCFVLFLFSIFIITDVSSHIRSQSTVDPGFDDFYGSLGGSMFSLFMAITGGYDWREILRPLQEINYYFYTVFFIFYVSFTVFGVMNVLTAVFVDAAGRISEIDRDLVIQEQMMETSSSVSALRKVFKDADVHNQNLLNKRQLEAHLQDSTVIAYLKFLELEVFEVKGLFKLLDTREKGVVDIDEFVIGMMRLKGPARGYDVALLMHDIEKIGLILGAFMKFVEDRLSEALPNEQGQRVSCVQDYIVQEQAVAKKSSAVSRARSHLDLSAPEMTGDSFTLVRKALLKRLLQFRPSQR